MVPFSKKKKVNVWFTAVCALSVSLSDTDVWFQKAKMATVEMLSLKFRKCSRC